MKKPGLGAATRRLRGAADLPTALAVVVAAAMVAPIVWLVADLGRLGPRALDLLVAPETVDVLLTSTALVAVVTTAAVVVGVALAVLTVQTDLPFRRFWTVVVALPLVVPSYLGAFAALSATGDYGLLAERFGVSVPALDGFLGAAAVLTLYTYPYVFLTTRASLLSLDDSLVRAARTLDASRREAFRRVTLPQILPGVTAGSLLVALYTLADFGTPSFMRVEVFTQVIYARYDGFMQDYAVLLALELLAVTAVILWLESRVGADRSGAYASRGAGGGTRYSLGRWRYVATLLPAGVAGLALAAPVAVFGLLAFRDAPGYAPGGTFTWSLAWNSVYVSLLAAAAAVVVALPVAFAAASSDSRLARLADRVSYVGFAVPGVVLGIALRELSLDADLLYKTIPLLVFAYVVRFMPQALGAIRTAVLQVDDQLVAAARTLGRSPAGAFRSVTLPLIAPGVASGAALVFLTTMKELPATLLLQPTGFDTLVTYIWAVRESGSYGAAAIPALVLIVVSGLSMVVILSQEK